MAETERGKLFKWSLILEELQTAAIIGTLIPLFKNLFSKGAEKLGKKVEEKLFGNLEDAKKTVEDNILYSEARLNGLLDPEIIDLEKFERDLKTKEENGEDKCQALVLYVVKGILLFKKDITKKTGGKDDPKEIINSVDYSKGEAWAVKFLRRLLDHQTFEERVAFLRHEEVFSLIPKKKETIDFLEKFGEAVSVCSKKMGEIIKDVSGAAKEESSNFSHDCASLRERARRFRESAGRKP